MAECYFPFRDHPERKQAESPPDAPPVSRIAWRKRLGGRRLR